VYGRIPWGRPSRSGNQLRRLFRMHQIELCLFDERGKETASRSPIDGVLLARYLPRIGPASVRATAYTAPGSHRATDCHPSKLLIDPYARALGRREWDRGPVPHHFVDESMALTTRQRAVAHAPSSINPYLIWSTTTARDAGHRRSSRVPRDGLHPADERVSRGRAGTYACLAHPAAIRYLGGSASPPSS